MSAALTDLADLEDAQLIDAAAATALGPVAEQFAIGLTATLAGRIDRSDPAQPAAANAVGRQFIPLVAELISTPEEQNDPIGDNAHSPVRGIVHRYPDRALLKVTHLCAVYCRFCFRREMIGSNADRALTEDELDRAIAYLEQTPSIWELILTGGDPLVLSNRRLERIVLRLSKIPHLKVLRLHTRIPVASPERIDAELLRLLRQPGLTTIVVVHANHADEFGPEAERACARLADAGIPLRSQTVLLKGVNNEATSLATLMRTFVENRIMPYYLHHPDLARGTGHFRVTVAEGQALMRTLRGRYSGLCQPEYVLDLPGGHGKVPIGPNYLADDHAESDGGQKTLRLTDYQGRQHDYPETG